MALQEQVEPQVLVVLMVLRVQMVAQALQELVVQMVAQEQVEQAE